MTWILTSTGRHFDYLNPDPASISIADISLALSRESRFNGHTSVFYSVAQHSVHVSLVVPPEQALEALLHDASEAYCKDIPAPLKQLLPDYKVIETRVDRAIRARFEVPMTPHSSVKRADLVLLATERRDLMPHDACPWECLEGIETLPECLSPLSPPMARAMFMARFREIQEGTR